jgi:uncharacterized protein YndB with AHSA1/START domain
MMTDRIEKSIEFKAPVSRVWRALTDYREFGEWFGVKLESPFISGQATHGQLTDAGCGQLTMKLVVQKIEPERLFSYTWHPYAIDSEMDYSQETPTLVEFKLEETATGTLLLLTESGFDKIPSSRRSEACLKHNEGWTKQLQNIESHVMQTA